MLTHNLGTLDRTLRIAGGLVLLYVGMSGVVTGAVGIALTVLAGLLGVTGLVGWCALYALLGIDTMGRSRGNHLPPA